MIWKNDFLQLKRPMSSKQSRKKSMQDQAPRLTEDELIEADGFEQKENALELLSRPKNPKPTSSQLLQRNFILQPKGRPVSAKP